MNTKQTKRAEIKKVTEIVKKFAPRGYFKYQDQRVGGCRVIYKGIMREWLSDSDLHCKLDKVIDAIAKEGVVGWSVNVQNNGVQKLFTM